MVVIFGLARPLPPRYNTPPHWGESRWHFGFCGFYMLLDLSEEVTYVFRCKGLRARVGMIIITRSTRRLRVRTTRLGLDGMGG
jgi:hypothetical protein